MFNKYPRLRFKIYTLVTLLLVTIVPWTATALNRPDGAKALQEGAKAASTTEELMVKSLMAISAGDLQQMYKRPYIAFSQPSKCLTWLAQQELWVLIL